MLVIWLLHMCDKYDPWLPLILKSTQHYVSTDIYYHMNVSQYAYVHVNQHVHMYGDTAQRFCHWQIQADTIKNCSLPLLCKFDTMEFVHIIIVWSLQLNVSCSCSRNVSPRVFDWNQFSGRRGGLVQDWGASLKDFARTLVCHTQWSEDCFYICS